MQLPMPPAWPRCNAASLMPTCLPAHVCPPSSPRPPPTPAPACARVPSRSCGSRASVHPASHAPQASVACLTCVLGGLTLPCPPVLGCWPATSCSTTPLLGCTPRRVLPGRCPQTKTADACKAVLMRSGDPEESIQDMVAKVFHRRVPCQQWACLMHQLWLRLAKPPRCRLFLPGPAR